MQSRVGRLQRGDPVPDGRFPLRLLPRQFLPDRCRQLLSLVALACFDPMPNLFGLLDRDRLAAVRTLGWQRFDGLAL
jgi:hypothetical protein